MNGTSLTIAIGFFAAAFAVSAIGVSLFTRWSRNHGLLDVPNERSSHSTPTPRGGGLVVAFVSLLGYLIIGFALGLPVSPGYLAGAALVALVSWLDDLYSLPFWSRLIVHVIAAGILIWDVGFWNELSLPLVSGEIGLGDVAGILLTSAWVVWLLNAYNFMDGIDGIAALQCLIACIAWALLASILNAPSVFLLSGMLASSSAGFLVHNWQPAKIFMGDVGSAFLGFTLAALPLLARQEMRQEAAILPLAAVILVWFFVFDTVFTFSRRLLGQQRVWEAHRQHVYQRLVMDGMPHSTVALLYGAASAFSSGMLLLAFLLSGIYWVFCFLSLLVLTAFLIFLGIRNKR
jgi:UDP-N-acetylmuramyl pentapeptide phosphotransferase/UDP-N-acetylglucosamine-1-phosphate transferase